MPSRHHLLLALFAVAAVACHSPTSPNDDVTSQPHGRLSGIVKIGPNCPVEQPENPCPTPPDAYRLRKIIVYNEAKTTLLHVIDIDSQGFYLIDLVPAIYTIDLRGVGIDRTSDLPKTVEIHANAVTTLNVSIDTGIR